MVSLFLSLFRAGSASLIDSITREDTMKQLPSRRKLSLSTETIRLMRDLPLSGLRTIQAGYAPAPTEYPW